MFASLGYRDSRVGQAGVNVNTPEPTLVEQVLPISIPAAVNLEQDTLPWRVLKVGEEGNNAIVNIALKLLIVHAPFPFIPTVHNHPLYSSHPNLPLVLSTWCKNLKQNLFLSSTDVLNGSCQCTGTHCPAVLLSKKSSKLCNYFAEVKLGIGR